MSSSESIKSILSSKLDKNLIDDLVESYEEVKNLFVRGDYESEISKSGKFVENVFRVLHYIRTGKVIVEVKQGEFQKISEALLNSPSADFPETIRIQIPSVALMIYQIRSKSGAIHVKQIDPDFIDGKLIVACCDWIIAEFLRIYHVRDSDAVWKLIQDVVKESIPVVQKVGDQIFVDAKVSCEDEITIRLFVEIDGADRKSIVGSMTPYFTPQNVDTSLRRLLTKKTVFRTKEGIYVLAESARKRVSTKILELSKISQST